MDQVWKGLSNLDPHDPGGFYKKPPLSIKKHILASGKKNTHFFFMKFAQFEEWMIWYIL